MATSTVLPHARRLIERNFAPIPVPFQKKKPDLEGWQNLRLNHETAAEHFNGKPINLGIILGAASGNLIDVDLDSCQACLAATMLAPATPWRTGRKSAPNSHYWYRAPAGLPSKTKIEFHDPIDKSGEHKGLLVEIRSGDGMQTLFLPSVHESGEKLEAYGDLKQDPAAIDASALVKSVGKIAAAALLAKHWPAGAFHNASLALAGALKKAGWSKEDATVFVEAVAAASNSQDVTDRIKGVEDTYEKDSPVTGAKKLGELIDQRVVSKALEWLGIRTAKSIKVRQIAPYQPFPVEALPEPVKTYVISSAAALGVESSYVALPVLAVLASCIGNTRSIRLKRGWNEPSVLWTTIIGDSGTLKTPAYLRAVEPLLESQGKLIDQYRSDLDQYDLDLGEWEKRKKQKGCELGEKPAPPKLTRIVSSDSTIERTAQSLEDNPRGILYARDEQGAWLGGMRRYKGRDGGSDVQNWLEMYRAGCINYERKTGDRNIVYVRRAAVSVTGGIQPGALANAMSNGEYLECGLAARLLMAMPPKTPKVWTEIEVADADEKAYADLLVKLRELTFDKYDGEDVPYVLKLDDAAKAVWIQFYGHWGREQAAAEGDIAAALSKLEGTAARIALIFHVVSCVHVEADDRRPVGVRCVEAGITLAKWAAEEARRIYSTFGESEFDRETRRLVEFIRSRGGKITVRALQRSNNRKYPDTDSAKAALDLLIEADVGHWTEPTTGPAGGHPVAHFVLNPCTTHDTTDTTPDDEDGDGGEPARHSPDTRPPTPTNPLEKEASVGCVMRRAEKNKTTESGAVADTMAGGEQVVSCTPHTLIDRQDDLGIVVAAIDETGLVGLDIETTGLNPRTDKARLLSLACDTTDGGTHVYVIDLATVDPSSLWPVLASKPIVGHNLAFDLAFLDKMDFAPGTTIDTMIESQLLYAGDHAVRKHSLADCCKRELGIDLDKTLQKADWSGTLTPAQVEYAALDADLPRRLHAALTIKIVEAKIEEARDLEHRTLPAMVWLAQSGIGFDRQAWLTVATESEAERGRLRTVLDAAAPARSQSEMFGPSWNWDSPADVKAAFKIAGIAIEKTDDDTLAAVDHPLADLIRQYRSASKRVGTYGREWLKHVADDDRVYAGWKQIGADSGRMACKEPNLQQLPRDERYRRCFIAPAGRVLIKADYSQIELRLAAKIANETTMIEAYRRGDDLHTLTASKILGKTTVTKDDRQVAKSLNFGLIYGMGATNLRTYCRSTYNVELTPEQAKDYRTAFFTTYPGLAKWHAKAGASRNEEITTRTIIGRHRLKVGRFTEKLNTPVQGTGADGLKAALGLLWESRGEHPTAFPVLAVHDEIVVECDEPDADAVCNWLKSAMIDGMKVLADPVPVEVEATIARTWGGK